MSSQSITRLDVQAKVCFHWLFGVIQYPLIRVQIGLMEYSLTRPFQYPRFSKTPIHIAITQCVVFNKSIRQVHSMIEDRTYRSVLVSYTILRDIRNSYRECAPVWCSCWTLLFVSLPHVLLQSRNTTDEMSGLGCIPIVGNLWGGECLFNKYTKLHKKSVQIRSIDIVAFGTKTN